MLVDVAAVLWFALVLPVELACPAVLKFVTDTVGGMSVGLRFSLVAHAEPARDNCRMQRERARDGEKYFMSGEEGIVGR